MKLIAVILRELPYNLKSIALMSILAAISTTTLLWLLKTVSKTAGDGATSPRLLFMYGVALTLIGVAHNYTLITASSDAETLIHRYRLRLFDAMRRADLVTVERIGRAALHGVLIGDTQTLARTLPMLAIGFQDTVMLVFLAAYLASLSPIACVMAFSSAGIAVAVHKLIMPSLLKHLGETAGAEAAVFNGLTDMMRGFKEVRMSRARADGLVGDLDKASAAAARANAKSKAEMGRSFTITGALFYGVIGMMVFVVPLFATDYHAVVVPAITAALFIVGPIGTVSFLAPMLTEASIAIGNIEAMESRLRGASPSERSEEGATPIGPPTAIALREGTFAYHDVDGIEVFSVGPLSAEFRAGEITFVTGGNGSGKSTMLRLLTGLIPLDRGNLLIDGEPVESGQLPAYRDQITAIFSDYHLSRRLYGIPDTNPARVQPLLERLEMQDKVSVRDGAFNTVDLSTGQRKRLALVVAWLEDKQVIVLDEWAADQDPHFRQVFYEELLPEMKARGKIVICVTHDDRWFSMADRIYHMNEGRVEIGDATQLFNNSGGSA